MSCGVCAPEAFREGGGVVYGYLTARTVDHAAWEARKLNYMGAQYVFADEPKGHVGLRRNFRRMSKLSRPGDKVILAAESALGTKPERVERHIEALEAKGVQVAILRPEYFESATA